MNIDLNNFKSCYNPLFFLDDLKNTSPYISQQPEDSLVNKMLYRRIHLDATEKSKSPGLYINFLRRKKLEAFLSRLLLCQ